MSTNPQYVVYFHYFRLFLESAAKENIDVAPLKGAHLLTSVYQGEERGALADVDFLVRPQDWSRTLLLLEKMGFERRYAPHRSVTNEEFHEAGFVRQFGHGQKMLVEPHRYLVQPQRHSIDYEALWNRSFASSFEGAPCRRLSAEDYLLHAAIHLTSHFFVQPSRELKDIELLIRIGGAQLDEVAGRAKAWECEYALWLALKLLELQSPDLSLRDHIERLAPPMPYRLALGRLVPDISGFKYSNLGLRAREALMFPLLLKPAQLLRFGSYYAHLRLRDALTNARNKREKSAAC